MAEGIITRRGGVKKEFIVATGGTVTDITDGGVPYRVHTFTSSGTFEITQTATFTEDAQVEYLVVGGGGGGGPGSYSAGGAGGLVFVPNGTVGSLSSYPVIVGSGGSIGNNGDDSSFLTTTGLGGGGGDGSDGGSGGSNGYTQGTNVGDGLQPSSSSGGFGNKAGNSINRSGGGASGGGGGAGEEGETTPAFGVGGKGGDGLSEVTISGSTYRFADVFGSTAGEIIDGDAWFAGGGGAGSQASGGTGGLGGKGGGGDANIGNPTLDGSPGMAATGGGGGTKANGGSGIVIVRYRIG